MSKNMEKMQNYPNSCADLQDQLDCAQRSLADLRKDIRVIMKVELQLFRESIVEQCEAIKQRSSEDVIN